MKYLFILFVIFVFNVNYCFSQGNQQFECPKKIWVANRTGYFFDDPGKAFITLGVGYLFCYPYSNKHKQLGEYYGIATRPKLYATAIYHKPITRRCDFFCGIQISQNQQGVALKYQSGGSKMEEDAYSGSVLFRIPIGVSYKITPSFNLSTGIAFIYSSHLSNITSGSGGGDYLNSNLVGYSYNWDNNFEDDKYYLGIDILASKTIHKRINLNLQISLDLHSSVATSGNADLEFSNGSSVSISAYTKPLLIYGGLGISYRFF